MMVALESHSPVQQVDAHPARHLHMIRLWLLVVAAMIALMVLVGGATRLTDSGLSITEWQPITGAVPPLSEADWDEAFEKYRQIPEYQQINKGMSLSEFKQIFWWEWGHRFLGRLIGVVFLVPLVVFAIRGMVPRWLMPRLVALFVLGGLQGGLGWFMVASGLVDRVDVSQYRLAAHLSLAIFIFACIIWVAESLRPRPAPSRVLRPGAWALAGLLMLQIVIGGFVAGLDAGLGYPTWPLMDGQIIPDGLLDMTPAWRNFTESVLTVQFNHRMLGYLVAAAMFAHALRLYRTGAVATAFALAVAVSLQIVLGIWTILSGVHLPIALSHQGVALVLVALLASHLQSMHQGDGKPKQ